MKIPIRNKRKFEQILKVRDILESTNNGRDLDPPHYWLVENAVNKTLTKKEDDALKALHAISQSPDGYQKSWFHGIEHLTIDYVGNIYWKNTRVETYLLQWAYSDEGKTAAQKLADKCNHLENIGVEVSMQTLIIEWDKHK